MGSGKGWLGNSLKTLIEVGGGGRYFKSENKRDRIGFFKKKSEVYTSKKFSLRWSNKD